MSLKFNNFSLLRNVFILLIITLASCSKEESNLETASEAEVETAQDSVSTDTEETDTDSTDSTGDEASSDNTEVTCTDAANFVFNEEEGLVLIEFEDGNFHENWSLKTTGDNYTGSGYMQWEGEQNLSNPGVGLVTYKLKITTPGTYQFLWKSAVKTGTNGTDHNDSWLRFNDATDFYGLKDNSKVYPKDTGKTPNPAGSTKDGWFKIYRSGSDLDFKWQAYTYDNNPHAIFVDFDNAGVYTMEVSARSSGHGIDKFALFNTNFTEAQATAITDFSAISCN